MEADCMGILKSAMAGMAVGKFWDVLEDVFGYEEDLLDVPKPPSPQPEEAAQDLPPGATTTKAAAEARASKTSGSQKRKKSGQKGSTKKPRGVLTLPIPLEKAGMVFPTKEERYHYAGNPDPFISARKSVKKLDSGEIRGVYACRYTELAASESEDSVPCSFVNESRIQMAQHVREYHLGVALGCWICQLVGKEYKVYGGKAWLEHMKKHHGKTHREFEFYKPAQLDLSVIKLDDEITLPDFLRLLAEQKPEGVSAVATDTATSVELKLELPAPQ